MELLSLLGILLGVVLFVAGVFKGYHITIVSIVAMAVVALFSQANPIDTLLGPWMARFASTYQSYFLIFFFSALFAKSLGDVGAAQSIAFQLTKMAYKFPGHEKLVAVLLLVLVNAVFTLGGISTFVVVFTVVYIAKEMFSRLDIPWKLYTCGTLGAATFTMSMVPGTPQLTNLIPMDYFNTPATAAPVLSTICSVLTLILGIFWIQFQVKRCEKSGEGFAPTGTALMESWDPSKEEKPVNIPLWKCLFPSVILLIVLNVFQASVVAALIAGTITSWLIFDPRKQLKMIKDAAVVAVQNANQAMVALASASGFGAVVASVSGFDYIISGLENLPGPPVVQVVVSVNIAAAFTASSAAGLKLAMDMLADRFIDSGLPLEAIHRLSSMSSSMLDDLPHSSGLANVYYTTRLKYKDAYINNFVISIVITTIVVVVACILVSLGLTY